MKQESIQMSHVPCNDADRYCIFRSGENWFGISAIAVRSILPVPHLSRIPHADASLEGVCHIQNEFVPVIRLRALTSLQYDNDESPEQYVVILNGPQGPWGMTTDEVSKLGELEVSVSTYAGQSDPWSRVILGSASWKQHVIQVLDPVATQQYASRLLEMYWQSDSQPHPQLSCNWS